MGEVVGDHDPGESACGGHESRYLQHRYYDPVTAQCLTIDPAVSLMQAPYSYANDDPINECDPQGLWSWNPLKWTEKNWELVGGVRLGVVAAATALLPEESLAGRFLVEWAGSV